MVNDLLDAITIQLHKTFGDNYKYYVENIEQNLVKPCFTIDTITSTKRSTSPVLYDRTVPIVIHYFNDKKSNTKKTGYAIAEQVSECLEYLPMLGVLLRGYDISWQFTEDVLQIFVTYKFTARNVQELDAMEDVSTQSSIKQ